MVNKKLIFIVLLLSIFTYSCNESFNIGADFLPSGDLLDIQITDTVDVFLTTEISTKVRTDNSAALLVGKYNDPYFGTTQAGFVTQILQSSYPAFTDDVIFDSICFQAQLYENNGVYGDSSQLFNFSVYKITKDLSTESTQYYYSDENPDIYTEMEELGSGNAYVYDYFEEKTINNKKVFITYKAMRLKLNNSLGLDFFENEQDYFYSYGKFTKLFKGIYVQSNDNNAMYKIRTTTTSEFDEFGLVMYYHTETSDSVRRYVLPFNSSSARFNLFTHDYTNSPFILNTTNRDSLAYIQSMAGTMVKFEAPGLKNFENVVINKAELLLQVAPNTYSDFKPIDFLWFAGFDTANNVVYFDDFAGQTYQGAEISDNNTYSFFVTRIVQDFIANTYQNLPINFYITNLASAVDFKRTILTNGNHSKPAKLIITYSKYK